MSYLTLSSQEKHRFYSVRTFTRIRQHYFSKYWGDQCMGRSPTSNFGGTVPPVPGPEALYCQVQRVSCEPWFTAWFNHLPKENHHIYESLKMFISKIKFNGSHKI